MQTSNVAIKYHVEIQAEIPESLMKWLQAYLDSNPHTDYDQVMERALFEFLSNHSYPRRSGSVL